MKSHLKHQKKILILPYTHTLSHLSRPLEVAKHLKKYGYKIEFGGDSTKVNFIKNENFLVHQIFEPNPDILFNNIRSKKIRFVEDDILLKMIQADLELFQSIKPDAVLSDGRFSAMLSTQIAKIKHIAIVNGSSTAYRSVPYFPMLKSFDIDITQQNSFFKHIFTKLNIVMEQFFFNQIMNSFSKLSNKYSVKTPVSATNCLCGADFTLIADFPSFFPTNSLPENYYYIGPITWKSNDQVPSPEWWPIKKNRKLIYLTMGTTGQSELFFNIYNQIADSDFQCIITTGNQTEKIESIPNKIYVANYMDGDSIMKISDIVVCHGGNGTIYQAISHGVPIIGIPTIPDQEFNMRRVEALGIGVKLSMNNVLNNTSILSDTFRRTNFSKLASNALDLESKSNKFLDGAVNASKKIFQFLEYV